MSVKLFSAALLILWGIQAAAHARLVYPTPRSSSAGIKTGPCGGFPKGSPITLQANQNVTIQWEETVNHPGKYIFSLAYANDSGFSQNVLGNVVDTKNTTGDLPHQYSQTIKMPNTNCETCTLQMIQSMEENPASPSYYYSCADIRLVNATGGGDPVNSQEANTQNSVKFGGCGTISGAGNNGPGPQNPSLMILLLPLMLLVYLRRSAKVSATN